jgi:hypothetical protein
MSQEVTRERYSMDPKEPTREENEITHETKQNNLILSEWEDQFSVMTSNKNRSSDRSRSGSSSKQNRRNRRSSSIFSPGSRISLAYDNSILTDRDAKQNDNAFTSTSSDSKVAIVTASSVSLTMLKSKKSFEITSTNAAPQTTPMYNVKPADANQTWDFVADLGSINSKGAMELSPHSSRPGTKEIACGSGMNAVMNTSNSMMSKKNNKPSFDVNLDTINAFAASIDNDLSNHSRAAEKNSSSSNSSLPCYEGIVSYVMAIK